VRNDLNRTTADRFDMVIDSKCMQSLDERSSQTVPSIFLENGESR
jgi:hypothetical protein